MTLEFTPPPIARQHCKHYSYSPGLDGGPRCAAGIDLSAPGRPVLACMPEPREECFLRAEWTAEERAAWESYSETRTERMVAAMAALPEVGQFQTVKVACPNCEGGTLTKSRTRKRVYVACSTPHCVKFEGQLA